MRKALGIVLAGIFFTTTFAFVWIPSPAVASPIKLNYAQFAPAPTFPAIQMERWKKEVEKRTNGQVVVNTFPGGTLLDAKDMIDGVIAGQADIGNTSTAYQPGRFFVTNATSLPLGFTDSVTASLTIWDFYKKYKPKEFSDVKVLTMFGTAPSNIMIKIPIRTLADIKGVDIRASGGAAQVLKAWGANPVGMPMPATVEALQKGVVQGLFSSLEVMKQFKFAETCRYVTITNSVIYPFVVVMNLDKWNSLPKDVQKVMDDLATEQSRWVGEYNNQAVEESMAWSKKNYNVEVIELSKEEKPKWDARVSGMIDQWIEEANAKGLPGKQMIDDIRAIAKKYEK